MKRVRRDTITLPPALIVQPCDTCSWLPCQLPSSFQFGSHVGAGLRFGERGQGRVGVGVQHLSNAGLKQPNGGINLILLSAGFEF